MPPSLDDEPLRVPFRPGPTYTQRVLEDLSTPDKSLFAIAALHHTTVAALSEWMALPEIRHQLTQIESACFQHARLVAASQLAHAATSLSLTLQGHAEIERNTPFAHDQDGIRQREKLRTSARKAAWLLYRISRSHPALPIDPTTLNHARSLGRAAPRTDATETTADHGPSHSTSSPHDSEPRALARAVLSPSHCSAPCGLHHTETTQHDTPSSSPRPFSVPLRVLRGETSSCPSSLCPSAPLPLSSPPSPSVPLRGLRGETSSLLFARDPPDR